MKYCNIKSVPMKGPKTELLNMSGNFIYIIMRLVDNMKYWEVDNNLSDCQVGARKGKSSKNDSL